MDYAYIAYTKDRMTVKGKLTADNEQEVTRLLAYGGLQVVSLKASQPFLDLRKLNIRKLNINLTKVTSREILMFSRQLALLLRMGIDAVNALELLGTQMTNRFFKNVIDDVTADIREGKPLSAALRQHTDVFPKVYYRAVAAGEQAGTLDVILQQMAEFLERTEATKKKLRSALSYPIFVMMVAVVVVAILIVFVLPVFVNMFKSLGGKLPLPTMILVILGGFLMHYGLYVILAVLIAAGIGFAYVRTPKGRYRWDKTILRLPIIGNIVQLNELTYCCRIMAMLFRVGLPPSEIMTMAVQGASNKIMAEALTGVQDKMMNGEGLARPMSQHSIFLPLMVQMVSVGERTGNLPTSLDTVAQTYEMDADERTRAAIGLIQPVMTLVIGAVVAFVAIAMVSAIFGIYGQVGNM